MILAYLLLYYFSKYLRFNAQRNVQVENTPSFQEFSRESKSRNSTPITPQKGSDFN